MKGDEEETAAEAELAERKGGEVSLRRIVWQTLVFTVVVVAMVAAAGWAFREPLTDMARWLVRDLGLWGVFAGVFAADAFTFPVPPDLYLVFGVADGERAAMVVATITVASIVAGNVAYLIGPYIEKIPLLRKRIAGFRKRGQTLFATYGVWAIGIAALTPVPFSVVCWMAGMYRMKYARFAASTFFRIPRMVGYFLLYKWGWAPELV